MVLYIRPSFELMSINMLLQEIYGPEPEPSMKVIQGTPPEEPLNEKIDFEAGRLCRSPGLPQNRPLPSLLQGGPRAAKRRKVPDPHPREHERRPSQDLQSPHDRLGPVHPPRGRDGQAGQSPRKGCESCKKRRVHHGHCHPPRGQSPLPSS